MMYNPEVIQAMRVIARYDCVEYHGNYCDSSCPMLTSSDGCLSIMLRKQLAHLDPELMPLEAPTYEELVAMPEAPCEAPDGPGNDTLPPAPEEPVEAATEPQKRKESELTALKDVAGRLHDTRCANVQCSDCPLHLTKAIVLNEYGGDTKCLSIVQEHLGNPKFK